MRSISRNTGSGSVPPPWKTKYDAANASAYRPSKHSAETALIDKVFDWIPMGTVLDVPCGNGRLSVHLAKKGYRITAVDYSDAMLELAHKAASANRLIFPVIKSDVENLDFTDQAFKTVLCFRLLHHFPEAATRQRVVSEICRVAEKYVALSYFSPYAISSLKRSLAQCCWGKTKKKHSFPLTEITAYFAAQGFGFVQDFPLLNIIHTLHIALYRRIRS
ncbi:MAG: class I SAM-dependent methyltransferase [Azoarcus sp.]|jgi:ubiquinone/menaquinone biosynthesis C-methylase UbiE|nr:class I SAM-dependent methyltransferase [Azoarcus sp.]